jgi:hypothetical protein
MNSPRWLKTKPSTQSARKALKVGKKQGGMALLSLHQIPKDKGSKRCPGQIDEELKQMPKTRGRNQKNNFSLRKPKSEVGNGNRKKGKKLCDELTTGLLRIRVPAQRHQCNVPPKYQSSILPSPCLHPPSSPRTAFLLLFLFLFHSVPPLLAPFLLLLLLLHLPNNTTLSPIHTVTKQAPQSPDPQLPKLHKNNVKHQFGHYIGQEKQPPNWALFEREIDRLPPGINKCQTGTEKNQPKNNKNNDNNKTPPKEPNESQKNCGKDTRGGETLEANTPIHPNHAISPLSQDLSLSLSRVCVCLRPFLSDALFVSKKRLNIGFFALLTGPASCIRNRSSRSTDEPPTHLPTHPIELSNLPGGS